MARDARARPLPHGPRRAGPPAGGQRARSLVPPSVRSTTSTCSRPTPSSSARGGGRVRAPGAAVQRRQGLGRPPALAVKAFRPGGFPFPVLHIDTGHNFPEVLEYRDRRWPTSASGCWCSVQDSIDRGRVATPAAGQPRTGSRPRRCSTPSPSTPSTPASAAPAGTRTRRGPRSGCFRSATRSGSGTPSNQRPELWQLYQGRVQPGEHLRAFPLSDWTELDIWQYIGREQIALPLHLLRPPTLGGRARRHAAGRGREWVVPAPAR